MPENSKAGAIAYQCECGKKWAFKKSDIDKDSKQQCTCGRAIVVYNNAIYSTRKK
jgi:hypothetical protein